MSFEALAALLQDGHDKGALKAVPYAETLGLTYERGDSGIAIVMPFAKSLIGAPSRLHGGTVAGLLEIASIAQLVYALGDQEALPLVKPINVTVDYLRAAACMETRATAVVTRLGRRVANIRAEAWQDDRDAPVAAAHMNVLLVRSRTRAGSGS